MFMSVYYLSTYIDKNKIIRNNECRMYTLDTNYKCYIFLI